MGGSTSRFGRPMRCLAVVVGRRGGGNERLRACMHAVRAPKRPMDGGMRSRRASKRPMRASRGAMGAPLRAMGASKGPMNAPMRPTEASEGRA